MRTDTQPTALGVLLRKLGSRERREEFAGLAGTSVNYLYQLAGCYEGRTACRSDLALRIATAASTMQRKYGTPAVTMEQLATMCSCGGRG